MISDTVPRPADETELIISKLAKYSSVDDIITTLCERSGYKWEEAAKFVHLIEFEHSYRVRKRQRPLLILIGVLMSAGDLVLMAYSMHSWLSGDVVPFTLTLRVIEFDFPNGGKLAMGLPIIGGRDSAGMDPRLAELMEGMGSESQTSDRRWC